MEPEELVKAVKAAIQYRVVAGLQHIYTGPFPQEAARAFLNVIKGRHGKMIRIEKDQSDRVDEQVPLCVAYEGERVLAILYGLPWDAWMSFIEGKPGWRSQEGDEIKWYN